MSQLETNKITKPSPNILHALAELYGIDYANLMEMAGYVTPKGTRGGDERHGRVKTFAEFNLTPNEEAELVNYLQYIRSKKRTDESG